MLSGIPKTTSATQEKGHSLSQRPLLCPTRPGDGLGVMWPGTALASNSGAQIPSLPHLQSPRLPAAEQKTETGTGRRRGKAPLSPRGCLDKHEAALQHPSPSQPPGERPGDLPCSSHRHSLVPLSGQAGMELMGLVATWTSAMIPGQGHPKRRAEELGHQHRLVMGPQKQPLGSPDPWRTSRELPALVSAPSSSSFSSSSATQAACGRETGPERGWRGCERPASPAPQPQNLPPPRGTKP